MTTLKTTRQERLKSAFEYLRFKGFVRKQKDLAEKMNTSAPNISNAMRGLDSFLTDGFFYRLNASFNNIFNVSWLLTGQGEMLASPASPATIASNNTYGDNASGNNNITISQSSDRSDVNRANYELRPILTKQLTSKPNTDVYLIVKEGKIRFEKLVAFPQYSDFDFYYQVRQDAMQPIYEKGDVLALVHVPEGADIIQGAAMIIDTRSFGFLFRRVYDRGDSYECKRINNQSVFEDQVIRKDDVIRLYRVVYSVRLGD